MVETPHFEVVIKKMRTRYSATSPLFPECKGFGKTEKEATQKLAHSVSQYISKMAKQSLESVLLSQNYTEVILETEAEKKEQRKIFSVNPSLVQLQKSVLLRMKLKQTLPPNEAEETKDIHVLFQEMEQALMAQASNSKQVEAVIGQLVEKVAGAEPGFIIGFPLSLN